MMRTNLSVLSAVLALAAACGSTSGAPTPGNKANSAPAKASQVVGGTAALSMFPAPVTSARVMKGSTLVASSPVAADGSFKLNIPPGTGYSIEFVSASGKVALAFPRRGGRTDHTFDVVGGGKDFDLGTLRYIGGAGTPKYAFGASDGGADGECVNGVDATTGALCVDDDQSGDECAADTETNDGERNDGETNDGETNDGEANDGVDCVDGIDAVTHAPCDGGPSANHADGETSDGVDCVDGLDSVTGVTCDGGPGANQADGETQDDTADPADAIIAEHNLPGSMGCSSSQFAADAGRGGRTAGDGEQQD